MRHFLYGLTAVGAFWQASSEHGAWRDLYVVVGVALGIAAVGPLIKWVWGSDT